MKNLTIIIVTFNSGEIIEKCLSKLNAEKYEVVVVDNASADNTTEIVTNKFPQVKLIKSEKNIGYFRANNLALRKVETEFALILNPDAFIDEENIEKVLKTLEKNSEIALAGPLLLTKYPLEKNDEAQQLKIVESNSIAKFEDFTAVKYIIGAVLFLRMSVFKEIGFFDEEIFLYYEDDEISWRAVKNGFKAAIITEVYGYHIGHGSSGSKLRNIYKRFWHRALSKLYWKKKQKGYLSALKSSLRLILMFLMKSIFYLVIFDFKKSVENFASCLGAIAFLINMKAFDSKGNARG
jgi:N-acetylglucosaminyl-diphospho-decaprenol L-rhamnosyltransferase